MLYAYIIEKIKQQKMIALLIDPDKQSIPSLQMLIELAEKSGVDFFLFGGSIIDKSPSIILTYLKKHTKLPVYLFPGNLLQLNEQADGILFLSLISGRNPEYLIGNHVHAAPFLKNSGMEVIPTGYILIDTGRRTAVEYVSNTIPIPSNKPDIAVATAIAGELLGLKLIYLEGGSGAESCIKLQLIREVKNNISIPLIVGGGIRTPEMAGEILKAGADVIVIGSVAEITPEILPEIAQTVKEWK